MNHDLTTRMNGREHRPRIATVGGEANACRETQTSEISEALEAQQNSRASFRKMGFASIGIVVVGAFIHRYWEQIVASAIGFTLGILHVIH